MDLEHDGKCFGVGAVEDVLEDENDEFHRRKVVVVEYDLVEFRLFEPRFGLGEDVAAYVVKVGHKEKYRRTRLFFAKFQLRCLLSIQFDEFRALDY